MKEAGKWDEPYKFAKLVGFKVVDGNLLKSFNKLGKSFAEVPLDALESLCTVDNEEVESNGSDKEEEQEEEQEDQEGNFIEEEKESDDDDVGGHAWKVGRRIAGSLTYLHIKRALKLLNSCCHENIFLGVVRKGTGHLRIFHKKNLSTRSTTLLNTATLR